MSQPAQSITLIHQKIGGDKYLYQRINSLLQTKNLNRFRIAVAYARWDGIGLVAESIESLLGAGGVFESIYGVDNGVTTPDALLYSLYLQKLFKTHTYAGFVEDVYANAIFHPKFFEFRFPDKTIAIIGSANFTGGGFVRNSEVSSLVQVVSGDPLVGELDSLWKALKAESKQTTLAMVRKLEKDAALASEQNKASESGTKKHKAFLSVKAMASPKPLFAKVLGLKEPKKKLAILAGLDPLSTKPKRLYLQVFKKETGGSGSNEGYQIQLPKATLAAYFGVSPATQPSATFIFGAETINTHFTHFPNNTHRLRLKPLRDTVRPAVVIFDRVGPSKYRCSLVPGSDYAAVLKNKCMEQTRPRARRWGLE